MSVTQIRRTTQIKPTGAFKWVTNDSTGTIQDTTVTASKAVATDANGLPVASSTTATELGGLHGLTASSIVATDGSGILTTLTDPLAIAHGGTNSNTALANGFLMVSSGGKIVEANGGDFTMDNGKITNVATPVSAQDAANKAYVDMAVNGLDWKQHVQAATAAVLPTSTYSNGASGVGATITSTDGAFPALVIDGYTVLLNDRVLIKNQASSFQNGIYTVTSTDNGNTTEWQLTRATDSNTPTLLEEGTAVFATQGSTNNDRGFVQTATVVTVGTSAITYITFTSSVSAYFAGNGLDLTGSTFSISTDNSLTANAGGSTPSLVVKLNATGAISTSGTGLTVNVDNSTIDISSNNIEVKAGGITNTQVNAAAGIVYSKLTLTNSIVDADIASGAAISFSKLHSLTSAHILVGNGSNVATDVAVSGDLTLANTGAFTIAAAAVTFSKTEQVVREVPSGTINGSNVTFTLAHTATAGSECVFLNGILQNVGGGNDYTISGGTITFNTAPLTNDVLLVNYWY